MKNKKQIFTTILSVLVSVFLVAGFAFAVTTIGTKVSIGTSTAAVSLSGVLNSGDFGLQTYTTLDTTVVDGWSAASNAYMTVADDQTGNVSVFGSISELDLGPAVDLSGSRNYGAMWGDLEILGATTLGPSTLGTPLWSGAVVATVIGSNTMVNSDYRQLAGVVVDSNLGTSVTPGTGGSISGILIRKSLGKTAWPVGLLIDTSSVTTDIQLQNGETITNSPDGTIAFGAANLTTSGTIKSSATGSIGWSVVAGANTACNTTCTNACVFGWDTGTTAIVACDSALADNCVCAGAN